MHWGAVGGPGKYEKCNLRWKIKTEFIEKLHLMIPLQFGRLRVGDNPTFEIDIVLLLNINRKIAKVSYQQFTRAPPLFPRDSVFYPVSELAAVYLK